MSSYQDYGYSTSTLPHTADYLVTALNRVLPLLHSKSILDVGCGNGSLTNKLIQAGYDAYGIDASVTGIEIARQHFGAERFYVSNVEEQRVPEPLRDKDFDTVLATEVIEHLYSPRAFVEFCADILPSGGRIVLTTPYHGYLKNLALALTGRWDQHLGPLWEGGHIKFFSRRTLAQLLESAGFRVTHFYGAGRLPYFWKSMVMAGVKK